MITTIRKILFMIFSVVSMQNLAVEDVDRRFTLNGSTIYGNLLADIYQVELFVTEKTQEAQKLMNSLEPKLIKLTFLIDIGQDTLKKSWMKTLQLALGHQYDAFSSKISKFLEKLEDIHEKDTMEFYFEGERLKIMRNQRPMAEIENSTFSKAVIGIWLGNHPIADKTRTGLLSKKKL